MRSWYVRVAGVDYEITARQGHEEYSAYVCLSVWTEVNMRGEPCSGWFKLILAETVSDDEMYGNHQPSLESVKWAFRSMRSKMRSWAEDWRFHRGLALEERGGKRAHQTRLANDRHRIMLEYAAHWKVCKAVWKELTKLL